MAIQKKDIELFTELLKDKITKVQLDWNQPWFNLTSVINPESLTGRMYKNSNSIYLNLISEKLGYALPIFATFAAAKKEGLSIKKNERSVPVIYVNKFAELKPSEIDRAKSEKTTISLEEYSKLSYYEQDRFVVRSYMDTHRVFNISQTNIQEKNPKLYEELIQKYTSQETVEKQIELNVAKLDYIIKENAWICPINVDKASNAAYYMPKTNKIVIPDKTRFADDKLFYSTLLHEMSHSTDAILKRTAKDYKLPRFDSYAKEELVAEISSALQCKELGIQSTISKENIGYLQHWLKSFDSDPKYFLTLHAELGKVANLFHKEFEKIDQVIKREEGINISPSQQNNQEYKHKI